MKIERNAAECAKCGDFIESKFTHDYQTCKCGAIFIDGGLDYLRAGGATEDFIPKYEYEGDDEKAN